MDIFLDNHEVEMWRLNLLVVTAFRIATKIEEKEFRMQKLEQLVSIDLVPCMFLI